MLNNSRYILLIPVAGKGERFDGKLPKQYCQLLGKEILAWTLEIFQQIIQIEQIFLIANKNDQHIDRYCTWPKVQIHKVGGPTRSVTVTNGLAQINCHNDDWILVHDSVRCLTSVDDILNLIDQLKYSSVGGILATKITDTIKLVNNNLEIIKTLDRNLIYSAQTPQMFRYKILKDAFKNNQTQLFTDEASAVERFGKPVEVVETKFPNLKITYPIDIKLAEFILLQKLQGKWQ